MPDPETDCGDYCFECLIDIEYDWDVKRGTAWLKLNLPSLEDFMKGYKRIAKGSLDPKSMENNCHAASNTLVELMKGKLKFKLERGHWLGEDARGGKRTVQQHSWTSIRVPDNNVGFIVDPTQWVFTGAKPALCISTEDDRRYDIGGYNIKAAILGEKKIPVRKGKTVKSNLKSEAKAWLSSKAKRDWGKWTDEEMITIANMDPRTMGGYAKEIFDSIIKCGNRAFIPVEGRDMAGV